MHEYGAIISMAIIQHSFVSILRIWGVLKINGTIATTKSNNGSETNNTKIQANKYHIRMQRIELKEHKCQNMWLFTQTHSKSSQHRKRIGKFIKKDFYYMKLYIQKKSRNKTGLMQKVLYPFPNNNYKESNLQRTWFDSGFSWLSGMACHLEE